MKKQIILSCLLIVLVQDVCCSGRLTWSQLSKASNNIKSFLPHEISNMPFEDIKSGSLTVKNIQITYVDIPDVYIKESNNILKIEIKNIGVGLQANFRYNTWIYSESGRITVSVSKTSIKLYVVLGSTLRPYHCTDYIGKLRLRFKGGLGSWLANLFSGTVESRVKRTLNNKICNAATKAIKKHQHRIMSFLKQ